MDPENGSSWKTLGLLYKRSLKLQIFITGVLFFITSDNFKMYYHVKSIALEFLMQFMHSWNCLCSHCCSFLTYALVILPFQTDFVRVVKTGFSCTKLGCHWFWKWCLWSCSFGNWERLAWIKHNRDIHEIAFELSEKSLIQWRRNNPLAIKHRAFAPTKRSFQRNSLLKKIF